jgi:hypothetical protein
MHYYWIDGVYTISKNTIANQTEIPKRPKGNWTWNGENWVRQTYTTQDALNSLRVLRNLKLNETDWRMVSDYPSSNQPEWQTYRQALRDITTQTPSLDSDGNLTGITWPTPPTD